MALSDEMKAFLAELAPMLQGVVHAALSAVPVAGPAAAAVVDMGIAAVEAHNPKYFPGTPHAAPVAPAAAVPGIASPLPSSDGSAKGDVAVLMGNAPIAPAPAQVASVPVEVQTLPGAYALIHALASKLEALSAATGLQTSAAMAAHA